MERVSKIVAFFRYPLERRLTAAANLIAITPIKKGGPHEPPFSYSIPTPAQKRSRSITLAQAATKSWTNLVPPSLEP